MRAKKKEEFYKLMDNKVIMEENNIINLTEEDNKKIKFYLDVLGYEMCFINPEQNKRKTFTVEKAINYIKKHDKNNIVEFNNIKAEANKITENYKRIKAESKAAKEKGASAEVKAAAPSDKQIKEAQKKMINENRKAFSEQRKYFIEHYGKSAYEEVKNTK